MTALQIPQTPSPADFLTNAAYDAGEEPETVDHLSPVELDIRDLDRRVRALEELAAWPDAPSTAVLDTSVGCTDCTGLRNELYPALDAAEARTARAEALIEEIAGIVKKSTSKVSLEVKAAIGAWRAPETPSPAPDASPASEPAVDDAAEAVHLAQDVRPASAGEGLGVPAPEAHVETWRAYARGQGYAGPDIDTMNRSQIRTMLGIEQPVEPAAGA